MSPFKKLALFVFIQCVSISVLAQEANTLLKEFKTCLSNERVKYSESSPIVIQWNGLKPFSKALIGYNPSYRASNEQLGNFSSSDFRKLLTLFPVYSLRFPPGTYANYYNWEEMSLDEVLVKSSKKKSMINSIDQQKEDNKGKLIKSDYKSFLKLSDDQNIWPFIILNPYLRDQSYNESIVKYVKQETKRIIHWELGNELSNTEYQYSKFDDGWNSKIYSKRISELGTYIKSKYPDDKVGVVAADLLEERGHISVPKWINEYVKSWNRDVASSKKYYDAVIFHPYINIFDKTTNETVKDMHKKTACKDLSNETKKVLAIYKWNYSSAQEVPKHYNAFIEENYSSKEVWVTEVGLLGNSEDHTLGYGVDKFMRTLFNLAYFSNWVGEVPELKTFMFHVLSYGKGSMSAIYPDGSLNANTLSYLLLNRLLEGADQISIERFNYTSNVYGSGVYSDTVIDPIIVIKAEGGETRRMLAINIGMESIPAVIPFGSAKQTVIEWNKAHTIMQGKYYRIEEISDVSTVKNQIILPPLSVVLINEAT